jgi:outer membrane receptor for ferrienterochelin and colicin
MTFAHRPRSAHDLEPSLASPRPRRRRTALVASALALAAVLGSTSALADTRTEARRHFKTGMDLVEKKKFTEGIKELEKAYEILPHPNVAFNIAQAQAEAGNLDYAVRAYRTYLQSDPPDRVDVAKIMAELEEKLAAQKAAAAGTAPSPTDPSKTGPTDPSKTGTTDPSDPGKTGPTDPGKTGPTDPGKTGPADPGKTGPTDPGKTPTEPGKTSPGDTGAAVARDRADTARIVGQARTEDIYQETVVTASRNAQSPLDSPNSTTIVTKQDIKLSGMTRIPELLRRVAGMDVMQVTGGDSNVSMRGFNSRLANKLLVLVNGRSVYNDILGSTFWESLSIDVDQIERIEVVRGPGSALYGANAFTGVVNIITIAPGEGKPGVRVGYGDHSEAYGSAWASGRDGDFSYRASAGYTRHPRWTREIAPGRLDAQVADFDQSLGSENVRLDLRTTQRINKDTSISVGGGYSRFALNVYGIGPFNDYQLKGDTADVTTDFKSKHINARAYFTRLAGRASVGYNYLGHSDYLSRPTQNSASAEVEYVNDFKLPAALKHDIHIGLGYRHKNVAWEYLQLDVPSENHGAIYLQDAMSVGKSFTFVASGRLDYVPYLGRVVPSPRASVIIKPTDRQAIRVSSSRAFRTPSFLESYLDLPIQLTLPGAELVSASKREDNPLFKTQPEQITTVEGSYLNQQNDSFEFELTAYYNRVTDLVALAVARPVTLSDKAGGLSGLNPASGRYTVAHGGWANRCDIQHVGGGEIGGRVYPIEGLDIFANYALSLSQQQRPEGCDVPEDKRTSAHKINVGVQVRTKAGLNGEVTFNYQSAQVWNEQVATATGIVYQEFPLPAYTLVNARIGYRFFNDRAEISGTVFNALAGVGSDDGAAPQQHPFGNRVGRRVMGFFSYSL